MSPIDGVNLVQTGSTVAAIEVNPALASCLGVGFAYNADVQGIKLTSNS